MGVSAKVLTECFLELILSSTVEPPRKGHFGTNINSSDLSPL